MGHRPSLGGREDFPRVHDAYIDLHLPAGTGKAQGRRRGRSGQAAGNEKVFGEAASGN